MEAAKIEPDVDVVGKWEDKKNNCSFDFKADGTYTYKGILEPEATGNYCIAGSRIYSSEVIDSWSATSLYNRFRWIGEYDSLDYSYGKRITYFPVLDGASTSIVFEKVE